MGKLYTVTEENFKEVLDKIQAITNKYKLKTVYSYNTVKSGVRNAEEEYGKPEYQQKSWGKKQVEGTLISRDGEYKPITYKEDYCYSYFVYTEEHWLKARHDRNPDSDEGKQWNNRKPLIILNVSQLRTIVIACNDKVSFNNKGFTVYTDNSSLKTKNEFKVYKNEFIINKAEKITDLADEIRQYMEDLDEEDMGGTDIEEMYPLDDDYFDEDSEDIWEDSVCDDGDYSYLGD